MQSTETTLAGLELATQLISHHASIFLGVIILGMNKPRPWKCPWTSSKKRKKRTKNENTAMNEQAKVDGKLKLRLWDQACKRSSREFLACRTGVIFCVFQENRGKSEASAKRELRAWGGFGKIYFR